MLILPRDAWMNRKERKRAKGTLVEEAIVVIYLSPMNFLENRNELKTNMMFNLLERE